MWWAAGEFGHGTLYPGPLHARPLLAPCWCPLGTAGIGDSEVTPEVFALPFLGADPHTRSTLLGKQSLLLLLWCAFTLCLAMALFRAAVWAGGGGGEGGCTQACRHFYVVSRFLCWTLLPRASGPGKCHSGFAFCTVPTMYPLMAACAWVWHGVFRVSPHSGAGLLSGSDHRQNNPSR